MEQWAFLERGYGGGTGVVGGASGFGHGSIGWGKGDGMGAIPHDYFDNDGIVDGSGKGVEGYTVCGDSPDQWEL